MQITRKGVPTEIAGVQPTVGEAAPDFKLDDLNGVPVQLSSLKGKTVLISVFPDIDTSVCDMQTRHFYTIAKEHPEVTILNISNNSAESLKSWCMTNGLDIEVLADSEGIFAEAYGLWMPEFQKLARSVFVVDKDGRLIYSEIVPEMAQEPDYQAALAAL